MTRETHSSYLLDTQHPQGTTKWHSIFFFFSLHFVQHLQFQVKRMRSQIRVLILSCSRSWWRNKSSDKETKQRVTAVPTLNQLIQLGSWLLCDAVNRKQQMALLMINCHVKLDQLTSSAAGKAPPTVDLIGWTWTRGSGWCNSRKKLSHNMLILNILKMFTYISFVFHQNIRVWLGVYHFIPIGLYSLNFSPVYIIRQQSYRKTTLLWNQFSQSISSIQGCPLACVYWSLRLATR